MHDPYLNVATDIKAHKKRFKSRKKYTGDYYVNDFTLEELRTIHLRSRYKFRSKENDKKYVL